MNFTRARWPRLLLVIAVALVAAILVEREEGAMAARPARHPQTKLTQVQRPPPMPLILRFDLRP